EEAFSMAIAAIEAAPSVQVEVIGTDIAPRALAAASHALYRPWSFRGVSPVVRQRWFVEEAGGARPVPAIRDRVRFAPLNLVEGDSKRRVVDVDVIFCRNVLLYFDAE